jgi:hypothetical protein
MNTDDYQRTLADFRAWAHRAAPGSVFTYFRTPPGHGEYENPPELFAYARELYEAGFAALFQKREPNETLYQAVACSISAICFLDTVEARTRPGSQPKIGQPTSLLETYANV